MACGCGFMLLVFFFFREEVEREEFERRGKCRGECVCVRMCEFTSLPGIIVEKEETEFL